MLLLEDVTQASKVFQLILWYSFQSYVVSPKIKFNSTCIIICELFCNFISAAKLREHDLYLLDHAILAEMLEKYEIPQDFTDYRVYMGSSGAKLLPRRRISNLCSYKLVSSVTECFSDFPAVSA